MTVEVGSFIDEERCEEARTPRITIRNLQTPFMAVIMGEAVNDILGNVHWLLWNVNRVEAIPRDIPPLAEVDHPIRGRQGRNSFGVIGYAPPCPPHGARRPYHFMVFGLREELDLEGGATHRDLQRTMEGRIVQYGVTTVVFERARVGHRSEGPEVGA